MKELRTCERVRKESGEISSNDPLVFFLYILIRDYLSSGKVEKIVTEAVEHGGKQIHFTNGWIAEYAINIAKDLKGS